MRRIVACVSQEASNVHFHIDRVPFSDFTGARLHVVDEPRNVIFSGLILCSKGKRLGEAGQYEIECAIYSGPANRPSLITKALKIDQSKQRRGIA